MLFWSGSLFYRQFKFVELCVAVIRSVKLSGSLKRGGDGMQCRIDQVLRALEAQNGLVLVAQVLKKMSDHAALADSGLARQQDGLTVAGERFAPARLDQFVIALAADKGCALVRGACSVEVAIERKLGFNTKRLNFAVAVEG